MAQRPTQRAAPRISVSALVEYMHAAPGRRRQIVKQQKEPSDFMVIYYQPAVDAITRDLVERRQGDAKLVSIADALYSDGGKSAWDTTRNTNNAKAIEKYLSFRDSLLIKKVAARRSPKSMNKLVYEGTRISVQPEVLLANDEGKVVGGIKLYFSKRQNGALTPESGGYPSALLWQLLEDEGYAPEHRHCLTVDVFAQSIYPSPRSYRRMLGDVQSACEEIALRWDLL